MRARKAKLFQDDARSADDRRFRDEIEADVFELWVGVSRLMSRLREPGASLKSGRRTPRRHRAAAVRRQTA